MTKKIAVIGAGSWGTALAINLSGKDHLVKLWDKDEAHLKNMKDSRENEKYLPGIKFNENIKIAFSIEEVLEEKDLDLVLFAVPAQHFRSVLKEAIPYLKKDTSIVNVAKGIEQKTLLTMSQVAEEVWGECKYVVLSGPSHAEEVGRKMPTTVAVASKNIELAEWVQDIFMTDRFRVYTNGDVIGVELGGALKNIIALGAGISDGMGFGDNAKAAMMTRGIQEMANLGEKLGAVKETFFGLSGIGDLIVTCTSIHSRNRRCGIMLGEGLSPKEATEKVGMVVEGMFTTEAAYELAKKIGVEMPITEQIYKVIRGEADAKESVTTLMTRQKKHETEELLK